MYLVSLTASNIKYNKGGINEAPTRQHVFITTLWFGYFFPLGTFAINFV